MPKKWRNNWDTNLTESQSRERDSLLLTLGNLAIIPQSLNTSIRDASWNIKKRGKGNKPGLDVCAAGLVTVYDALQTEDWNEAEIVNRAEYLYNNAKLLWKI